MTTPDQASDTGNATNQGDAPAHSPDNPFVEPPAATPPAPTPQAGAAPEGDTNDSINLPLDGVVDVETLKKMVGRLRHENGNRRRAERELEEKVQTLTSWKLNHQNGLTEAEERAEAAEKLARQYVAKAVALEYNIDDDLVEFIQGDTEEEMWAKAEKLANTKGRKGSPGKPTKTPTQTDLFPGRRGTPVGKTGEDESSEWFKDFWSNR